jgi:hypothetical protein
MKKLQSTLNLGGGGLALGYYRVWGSSSTRVGYCRSGMAGLVSGGSGTGTVAPRVAATQRVFAFALWLSDGGVDRVGCPGQDWKKCLAPLLPQFHSRVSETGVHEQ